MPSSYCAVSRFLSNVSTLPMLNQTYCCETHTRTRSEPSVAPRTLLCRQEHTHPVRRRLPRRENHLHVALVHHLQPIHLKTHSSGQLPVFTSSGPDFLHVVTTVTSFNLIGLSCLRDRVHSGSGVTGQEHQRPLVFLPRNSYIKKHSDVVTGKCNYSQNGCISAAAETQPLYFQIAIDIIVN